MAPRPLPDPLPDHITAKMWEGKRVAPIDPATGRTIEGVAAVHLREGWMEQYEFEPGSIRRLKMKNGTYAPPVRKQANFDLVDRATGMTVAKVRGLDVLESDR